MNQQPAPTHSETGETVEEYIERRKEELRAEDAQS